MKKRLKNTINLIGFSLLIITSCSDYLDVAPRDKLLETEVFNKKTATEEALNSCYLNMCSSYVYGENLTLGYIEALSQSFSTPGFDVIFGKYLKYSYKDAAVEYSLINIWSTMYKNILSINDFVRGLRGAKTEVISDEHRNILEGEAIGLRAMYHFDLLRLFGPVYKNNSASISIPYDTIADTKISPRLRADKVIYLVLKDLSEAEKLLEKDPIRTYGKLSVDESADLNENDPINDYKGSNFYRYRNLRMNYYAVKALQARVNLYAGNKIEALNTAKAVIDQGSKWFAWTDPKNIVSAGDNADRLFSSEVIFGLENRDIADNSKGLFQVKEYYNPDLQFIKDRMLKKLFPDKKDYRYILNWIRVPAGKVSEEYPDSRMFVKFRFEVPTNSQQKPSSIYLQPLIRISEMYYIAAEVEMDTNPTESLRYLNTVRHHRGIVDELPSTADINSEIQKEYQKEFYGEGQLFFYYKRRNVKKIFGQTRFSIIGNINMDDAKYVLPIPQEELNYQENINKQ